MNYIYYPDELYHFGVKGQKWGQRRYQNPDGTLTEEGRIRYGKEYKKKMIKIQKRESENWMSNYVDTHNKSADYQNKYVIDKFNEKWKGNYNQDDYENSYSELNEKIFKYYRTKGNLERFRNSKEFKEAYKLVDKYNMMEYDELVQKNGQEIKNAEEELRKIEEYLRKEGYDTSHL